MAVPVEGFHRILPRFNCLRAAFPANSQDAIHIAKTRWKPLMKRGSSSEPRSLEPDSNSPEARLTLRRGYAFQLLVFSTAVWAFVSVTALVGREPWWLLAFASLAALSVWGLLVY